MSFLWYIVQTRTQYEKKVVEHLKKTITEKGKSHLFEEIIIPEEEVVQDVNGKRKTVKKLLFPTYVLIKMQATPEAIQLVKGTQHVSGFLGGNTHPAPMSEDEANSMLKRKAEGFKSVSSSFNEGDSVKISEGPFKDFKGTVVSVEKDKVKVNVSVFGRPTPVEVPVSQLIQSK